MSSPIALLSDNFTNNTIDPVWSGTTWTGSASFAETGGQAVLTLPSSTAGSHQAIYRTSGTYDLTGGSFYWNIGTMVATGVAATATFDLYIDGSNALRWQQLSNTITARTIVAGVDTQQYTAAWSSSTYKYLRIRESGGNVLFDSSTNGTTWTNRASFGAPIAVTSLYVQFSASCGNVASPGSLRLDDVNLILPAPSATWRETTADWSIVNRLRSVTLASDGGKQGAIVTAETMDETTRALGGTLRYFAGPLGSTSGGYLELTEYASLVLAQASAFTLPINGRVDLPAQVDARYMRLYHRSTDASAHTIYEYMPRRLVQADDIEAESITAINIAAQAITADKIYVLDLSAITATIGQLTIASSAGLNAWIYQGTGTGDSPTTGLKIFNSGGIGKLSGYNATVEQITLDTDGRLKAGAGAIVLDATGLAVNNSLGGFGSVPSVRLQASGVNYAYITAYDDGANASLSVSHGGIASRVNNLNLTSTPSSSAGHATAGMYAQFSSTQAYVQADYTNAVTSILAHATTTTVDGTLNIGVGANVGTATGATAGQVLGQVSDAGTANQAIVFRLDHKSSSAPAANFGTAIEFRAESSSTDSQLQGDILSAWTDATHASRKAILVFRGGDSVGAREFLRGGANGSAATIGFFGATAVVKPTVTGAKAGNAALTSLLTQLATLGLITDSST